MGNKIQKCSGVIVLDLGTSAFKCGLVSATLQIIAACKHDVQMQKHSGLIEIDFEAAYQTCFALIRHIIGEAAAKRYRPGALIITSQAQTFVPVDHDFKPMMTGISWLDARAAEEADFLWQSIKNIPLKMGYRRPSPMLYSSKLVWLKNHQPEIYRKAHAFPLLNEFIVQKLTGEFYTDYTNFGMTGMLDICRRKFNQEMLSLLKLSAPQFPELGSAFEIAYPISKSARQQLDVDYELPVYLAGNDQASSACGAGLKNIGDVSVNLGTAMVFFTLIETPVEQLKESQIVGIDPICGRFYFLSYEKDFGEKIQNLKQAYFSENSYDEMFAAYYHAKKENATIEQDVNRDVEQVIDHSIERFKYHLAEIENKVTPKVIYVSGGVAQSPMWIKIMQQNCKYELVTNIQQEAGIIGAARIYAEKKKLF